MKKKSKVLDIFNKKKILKLEKEIESYRTTLLQMRGEIDYLKHKKKELEEENKELKFTLKHQRTY